MTKPIARGPMLRKRVFDVDIIVLCVRWYISSGTPEPTDRAIKNIS